MTRYRAIVVPETRGEETGRDDATSIDEGAWLRGIKISNLYVISWKVVKRLQIPDQCRASETLLGPVWRAAGLDSASLV